LCPRVRIQRTLPIGAEPAAASTSYANDAMSPTWIWMQIAIVVFVLIGMVIAIVKLA
jgi:hypothetical protein